MYEQEKTQIGRYAALSHCWGSFQPLVSIKNDIKARKQGLYQDELPRIFRDAVELCRELRVAYLWIDSLCIIQDDDSDWTIESSKMQDIYRNACLVISAVHTADSRGDLFTDHTHRSLDLFDSEGRPYGIYAQEPGWYDVIQTPFEGKINYSYVDAVISMSKSA